MPLPCIRKEKCPPPLAGDGARKCVRGAENMVFYYKPPLVMLAHDIPRQGRGEL
jgi:hypothetical protein